MREKTDQKNSEYGHVSRSGSHNKKKSVYSFDYSRSNFQMCKQTKYTLNAENISEWKCRTDKKSRKIFHDLRDIFCAQILFLMSGQLFLSTNFFRIIIFFSIETFFGLVNLK